MKRRIALGFLTIFVICLMFTAKPISVRATTTYESKVLAIPDLKAYYPMNETSGTTIEDSLGNYDGTYSGATLNSAAGPGTTMGNAPYFDGINDYGTLPDGFMTMFGTIYNEATISLWIKPDSGSYNTYRTAFVLGAVSNTSRFYVGLENTPGSEMVVSYNRNTTTEVQIFKTQNAPTAWTHLLLRVSENEAESRGFENGNDIGNGAQYHLTATIVYAQIGSYPANTYNFKGYIDGIAIYNRALSEAEIAILANPNPVDPTPTPTSAATATNTPRSPQLILTLGNGNQYEIDFSITAGDIAQIIPALLLIALLVFVIILKMVRQ